MARKIVIILLIIIAWILLFTDYGKKIEEVFFFRADRVEKKIKEFPLVGDSSHGENIEEFFPLKAGKVWRYTTTHSTKGKGKLTITNLPEMELNQKKTTPRKYEFIHEKGGSLSYIIYFVNESEGIYQFARKSPTDSQPMIYPNLYLFKKPIQVGTNWQTATHGIIEAVDEEVTVPAGIFKRCVKVKTIFRKSQKTEWFAPGTGSVKYIYNAPDEISVFELENYK